MRWFAALLVAALVAAQSLTVAAPTLIELKSTLDGEVVEVLAVNAAVKEGDAVLRVRTATQARAVAATAPSDGTIAEVRVKVGDRVRIGAVVATLQPK